MGATLEELRKKNFDQRQAIEVLAVELGRTKQSLEFTRQWYAERIEKIKNIAKREDIWPEVAAVIANGDSTRQLDDGSWFYDPPTYAQQLNAAKFKAESADKKSAQIKSEMTSALEEALDALRDNASPRERNNAKVSIEEALSATT